jgi:hypothetical protein
LIDRRPRIHRTLHRCFPSLLLALAAALTAAAGAAPGPVLVLENEEARIAIDRDGRGFALIDRKTGADVAAPDAAGSWIRAKIGGADRGATSVERRGDTLHVIFGSSGAAADLRLAARKRHFTIEVAAVDGPQVEALTFIDIPLRLKGSEEEAFAATLLALNLKTDVSEIPGPASRLRARCAARFGLAGARAAIVACPFASMRDVLKEVVGEATDVPRSPIGGPWALDAEASRGSYLFNFGGLTAETADAWIAAVRAVGFNQIDFHGGGSFRFGDCRPDPATYPKGFESLKAAIDKLHAAGIKAGLHTYAFFIDKGCPWVGPVPDPGLGKDATFTLAVPLAAGATEVVVREPTKDMTATTGFFVRNSATLQVGDELIVYGGVRKDPPFAFTGCRRGAHGTKAAAHAPGASVHHLKECFGLFAPGGDSNLLEEVAARTAEAYNRCGFDMIYLDALDGEDVLGGGENAWHYGSKYVFELWKRLERPAVMEMSTFHHHLWYVRSRMGAWDHPTRSHKRFIDIHCDANRDLARRFLPGQLGWWAVKTWSGHQGEPTFPDDIEYLCGKALGNGTGLSLMGIDPATLVSVPACARLAGIFRDYETLRASGAIGEAVKARLREPGKEFSLSLEGGRPTFRPAIHERHRVEGLDGWSDSWTVESPFGDGPLRLRIEALLSAGPYDDPEAIVIEDFADAGDFADRAAAPGVKVDLLPARRPGGAGDAGWKGPAGTLAAASEAKVRRGSWAKVRKEFAAPLDLSKRQALGVWVRGDGRGEVLDLQLTCPPHVVAGIGEHYVVVDFEGWRYFELIEPEGERWALHSWPYGDPYSIYRESIDYGRVSSLALWFNDLPPGAEASCALSPIRALPLVSIRLSKPWIAMNGKKVVFPAEIESGSSLELSPSGCVLYGPRGETLREVRPQGDIPALRRGKNAVSFGCEGGPGARPRARVTVTALGDAL